MKQSRGFIGLPALLAIIVVLLAAGGGTAWYLEHRPSTPPNQELLNEIQGQNQAQWQASTSPAAASNQPGDFKVSPSSGTAPLTVDMYMSGKDLPVTRIDFGNGQTWSQSDVQVDKEYGSVDCTAAAKDTVCHTRMLYTDPGTYTVQLYGHDAVLDKATVTVQSSDTTYYNDSPLGISFSYPKAWELVPTPPGSGIVKIHVNKDFTITVQGALQDSRPMQLDDLLRTPVEGGSTTWYQQKVNADTMKHNSFSSTTVDGDVEAIETVSDCSQEHQIVDGTQVEFSTRLEVEFVRNGMYYIVSGYDHCAYSSSVDVFNAFVSSIRFQ